METEADVRKERDELKLERDKLKSLLRELKERGYLGCITMIGHCGVCLPCRAKAGAK